MKNIKKILLFSLVLFVFSTIFVNAEEKIKLQCAYKGTLPLDYANEPIVYQLTFTLTGEEGKNSTFTTKLNVLEDPIEFCPPGTDINECVRKQVKAVYCSDKVYKDIEKCINDSINHYNLGYTFGPNKDNSGNAVLNILDTKKDSKNKEYYEVYTGDKVSYFVKDNKYKCPDEISMLKYFSWADDNNYTAFIDKNGSFDTKKCKNNFLTVGDGYKYNCQDSNIYSYLKNWVLFDSTLYPKIETDYDNGTITGGYSSCCTYKVDNTSDKVYTYSFNDGDRATTYTACYGKSTCMTLSPTINRIMNDSSWNDYHHLGDCSQMPEKIYFRFDGKTYTGTIQKSSTCTVPKTEPASRDDRYDDAVFYPSKPDLPDVDWGDPVSVNCDGIIGKDMLDFLNKIFRWIYILAPIFVIVVTSADFASALLQDDRDAMKKASNKFVKRLIIVVVLFFLPLLINFVLNVFNEITGSGSSTCIGRR